MFALRHLQCIACGTGALLRHCWLTYTQHLSSHPGNLLVAAALIHQRQVLGQSEDAGPSLAAAHVDAQHLHWPAVLALEDVQGAERQPVAL